MAVGLPRLHVQTAPFRVFAINVYKIDVRLHEYLACDQRRGLLIAFPIMKNILLNSDTPDLDLDHQSDCLFTQIWLYLIKDIYCN